VLAALHCLNCTHAIPPEYWNDQEAATCRGCGERIVARVFPAMNRKPEAVAADRIAADTEASCFYHAANRAAISCEQCGRFLCALCDLDLDGRHLCPACLQRGVSVEKSASFDDRRLQYDSLALHLLTWPIFTVWLPMFAAPAALYFVIRHWNTPMSILPRTRLRLWLAALLGLAEVVGIVALILSVVWYAPQARK